MDIHLPDDLANALKSKAEAMGADAADVAIQAIKRTLTSDQRLDELLAPVRAAYEESGMSEDELGDLLEAEKHAMRRERKAPAE